MYLGKIAELASSDTLYKNPGHPYTEALLSAVPMPDPEYRRKRIILEGNIPSPINPPSGCRFHTRCSYAQQKGRINECAAREPALRKMDEDHWVTCHFPEDLDLEGVEAPGAINQDQ
jgi:oligopeptide/dipeptide ABC transporter ATP-binding protein